MHHALAKEHRDFFQKHGWIEFDELISGEQLVIMKQSLEEALSNRVGLAPAQLLSADGDLLFTHSRDLWRSNENLRKVIFSQKLGSIASELVEKRPLRLAFDFYIPPNHLNVYPSNTHSSFTNFMLASSTLQEMSCIEGTLCALLLCLTHTPTTPSPSSPPNDPLETPDLFSKSVRGGVFFHASTQFDRRLMTLHPHSSYYLIVYAQQFSSYVERPGDPHGSFLKKQGFVYNDRLNDRFNPIIFR